MVGVLIELDICVFTSRSQISTNIGVVIRTHHQVRERLLNHTLIKRSNYIGEVVPIVVVAMRRSERSTEIAHIVLTHHALGDIRPIQMICVVSIPTLSLVTGRRVLADFQMSEICET